VDDDGVLSPRLGVRDVPQHVADGGGVRLRGAGLADVITLFLLLLLLLFIAVL